MLRAHGLLVSPGIPPAVLKPHGLLVSPGIPPAVLKPHGLLVYAQNLWTTLCIVWGETTQVLNPRTTFASAQYLDAVDGHRAQRPVNLWRSTALYRG